MGTGGRQMRGFSRALTSFNILITVPTSIAGCELHNQRKVDKSARRVRNEKTRFFFMETVPNFRNMGGYRVWLRYFGRVLRRFACRRPQRNSVASFSYQRFGGTGRLCGTSRSDRHSCTGIDPFGVLRDSPRFDLFVVGVLDEVITHTRLTGI